MPELLLELFSEEIPARMQAQAAKDLERLVVGSLSDRGLLFDGIKTFSGPRRLTLVIAGLPAQQKDVEEERKGPRIGAPEKAIEGFLRSAGVTLDQCAKENDGKGQYYVARIKRVGRPTADVLAEILPETLAKLPWPKSMRWPGSPVRWVRPLHAVVCALDGEVVPFTFAGVESGRTTYGHRILSKGEIEVRRYEDYAKKLHDAHVVLSAGERRGIILNDMKQKAFALGLDWIDDQGLLDEVSGLAEWPVVLFGKIDDAFMDVPGEILQTAMRTHQKYFSLKPAESANERSALSNRFAFVSNMIAADGGAEIVAGNERVLRARLSDAKFFWDQDRKRRLESRVADLKKSIFHAKAGTMHDRAYRVALLAMMLADLLGCDIVKAERAGLLAKADLASGIVGEFPELQGVMGYFFARNDGEDDDVSLAVRDHYKPLGPGDSAPETPISIAVALADKIDSLVTLWRAGEKPTGSKDPFALRRAGLGIIRIILENKLRLALAIPLRAVMVISQAHAERSWDERLSGALSSRTLLKGIADDLAATAGKSDGATQGDLEVVADVLDFLADRLKVALRDKGARHDLIDAVFSLGGEDDLVRLVARVDALQAFLKTEDGANLLVGYRRAVNIVKAEEKKDKTTYEGEPDPKLLQAPEEIALFKEMAEARELIAAELAHERFTEAMTVMARLRGPVDAFFDKVTVNVPDAKLRQNRLLLLSRLRASLHAVADFSKIEG
ncbi:MAG TPA: glycine--tRNA ligase subunit beta [Rhizomicrobium sp.]|nr:glycine--tRNA ligase subunit beta [Rhizomicrobium sp.]